LSDFDDIWYMQKDFCYRPIIVSFIDFDRSTWHWKWSSKIPPKCQYYLSVYQKLLHPKTRIITTTAVRIQKSGNLNLMKVFGYSIGV